MIAVIVEGGNVQDVVSDDPDLIGKAYVTVIDYDIDNGGLIRGEACDITGHLVVKIDDDILAELETN